MSENIHSSLYAGNFIPSIFKLTTFLKKNNRVIISLPDRAENRFWSTYLKEQGIFANTNYSFGYSVINGGTIIPKNVKVYSVQSGDRIILATDGYPKLFDTLEASEQYLELKLKEDPDCVYSLRGTKGVSSGNVSFDDRAFIGFSVD